MPTIVTAQRYNQLHQRLATIYGPNQSQASLADSQTGYGQPLRSNQVIGDYDTNPTSVDKVTAQQWLNLYLDISGARIYQIGTSAFNFSNFIPVAGVEKIDEDFLVLMETTMTLVERDKFLAAVGNRTLENAVDGTGTNIRARRTTNWNGTLTHEFIVNFSSGATRSGFFNAGGNIRFDPTLTLPASYNTKTFDWYALLRDVGVIIFDKDGVSNTGTNSISNNRGNYNLNSSYRTIASATGADYAANEWRLQARNTSSPEQLQFRVQFRDLDTGTGTSAKGSTPIDENVQGTIESKVQLFRPTGTFTFQTSNYTSVFIPKPSCTVLNTF